MTIMISKGKKGNDKYFYIRNVADGTITDIGTFCNIFYMTKNGKFIQHSDDKEAKFRTLREAISIFRKYYPKTNYYVEKEIQK